MDSQNDQIVIIFLVSTAFVVLLAILVVLFLVIYQKRIMHQEVRLQKIENERQHLMLKATIEGQERERKRLAKELHDGIGSLLSGLSLNLKYQKDKETKGSNQAEFLTEACTLLDEGIINIRQISHDLLPITLETFGLEAAIKECIQPIKKVGEMQFDLNFPSKTFRCAHEIELGLLRIFQELVQNTLKHAAASAIGLKLMCEDGFIHLQYQDDGKGMGGDLGTQQAGIGIKNMESRVEALGGKIDFTSTKSIPLLVDVRVPNQLITQDL